MPRTHTLKENEVKALPLTALQLDPENIRKTFDQESLKELAADIKLRGVEQPITVTQNGKAGIFTIKHGERRYKAAQLAKLKTIPCILGKKETGDDAEFKRLADQWAENMLREDLNPIDIAEFFKTCRDDYNMVAKQIPDYLKSYGIKCDYNESTIRGMIRLVELPAWAKDYIRAGKLTASHGRAILPALKSANVMNDIKAELDNYFKNSAAYPEDNEPLTVNDLQGLVDNYFEKHHPRALTFGDRYSYLPEDKRVLYDIKKLDKDTLEKLSTVEVTDQYGKKEIYILNTQLHQELQKQAKAAITARGKGRTKGADVGAGHAREKTAAGKSANDDKPEPKTEASEERLQNWLHNYLAIWIFNKFKSMSPDARHPILQNIMFWFTLGSPGNWTGGRTGIHSGIKDAIEHVANHVMLYMLPYDKHPDYCGLTFENTVTLAAHLGFNIDNDITIDNAFAEMYTGAGIEKIIYSAKLESADEWRGAIKTAEKRAALVDLAEKISTPKPVKQLWIDTIK